LPAVLDRVGMGQDQKPPSAGSLLPIRATARTRRERTARPFRRASATGAGRRREPEKPACPDKSSGTSGVRNFSDAPKALCRKLFSSVMRGDAFVYAAAAGSDRHGSAGRRRTLAAKRTSRTCFDRDTDVLSKESRRERLNRLAPSGEAHSPAIVLTGCAVRFAVDRQRKATAERRQLPKWHGSGVRSAPMILPGTSGVHEESSDVRLIHLRPTGSSAVSGIRSASSDASRSQSMKPPDCRCHSCA
jgi:hypothetical protein